MTLDRTFSSQKLIAADEAYEASFRLFMRATDVVRHYTQRLYNMSGSLYFKNMSLVCWEPLSGQEDVPYHPSLVPSLPFLSLCRLPAIVTSCLFCICFTYLCTANFMSLDIAIFFQYNMRAPTLPSCSNF